MEEIFLENTSLILRTQTTFVFFQVDFHLLKIYPKTSQVVAIQREISKAIWHPFSKNNHIVIATSDCHIISLDVFNKEVIHDRDLSKENESLLTDSIVSIDFGYSGAMQLCLFILTSHGKLFIIYPYLIPDIFIPSSYLDEWELEDDSVINGKEFSFFMEQFKEYLTKRVVYLEGENYIQTNKLDSIFTPRLQQFFYTHLNNHKISDIPPKISKTDKVYYQDLICLKGNGIAIATNRGIIDLFVILDNLTPIWKDFGMRKGRIFVQHISQAIIQHNDETNAYFLKHPNDGDSLIYIDCSGVFSITFQSLRGIDKFLQGEVESISVLNPNESQTMIKLISDSLFHMLGGHGTNPTGATISSLNGVSKIISIPRDPKSFNQWEKGVSINSFADLWLPKSTKAPLPIRFEIWPTEKAKKLIKELEEYKYKGNINNSKDFSVLLSNMKNMMEKVGIEKYSILEKLHVLAKAHIVKRKELQLTHQSRIDRLLEYSITNNIKKSNDKIQELKKKQDKLKLKAQNLLNVILKYKPKTEEELFIISQLNSISVQIKRLDLELKKFSNTEFNPTNIQLGTISARQVSDYEKELKKNFLLIKRNLSNLNLNENNFNSKIL